MTLTATVSPSSAGGTVTFYDGTTSLGTATLNSGSATLTTSSLAAGTHNITASYGGSSTYGASNSNSVAVLVTLSASDESWNISTGANSKDLVEGTTFSHTVSIDLSTLTISTSSTGLQVGTAGSGTTAITLDGKTVITVAEDTYGLTINSTVPEGTYVAYGLSGQYNGSVTFYSTEKFKLELNGANITSPDGPALNIQSGKRAFVVLGTGSNNVLSDSTTWSNRYLADGTAMDLKATLFSEGALIFSGSGSLAITGAKKHAICSDDHVRIREGTYSITANAKTASARTMPSSWMAAQ